jgi:predicted nucleotidyltransferase
MKNGFNKIARDFNLSLIVLFGSVADDVANAESDVDIAILPKTKLSFKRELSLRFLLSSRLGKETDLSLLDKFEPLLNAEVAQHGKLLAGNKRAFNHFKVQAMKQYMDFEPYFKMRENNVKKLIKSYA